MKHDLEYDCKKKKSVPNLFITSSFRTFTNLSGLNTKVDLIRVELKIIETFLGSLLVLHKTT